MNIKERTPTPLLNTQYPTYTPQAMLTLSFMVYPGVSVLLFRYFKCVPVGGGMSDVLLVDMRIECESVLYQR